MWVADQWKEYEIIDCSKGEKLERWGDYILLRPDPQVLWDLPRKNPAWKKLNGHYHRSNKGGGEWEFFDLPKQWSINYKDLTFHLKPFTFKHTGLFLHGPFPASLEQAQKSVAYLSICLLLYACNNPLSLLSIFIEL